MRASRDLSTGQNHFSAFPSLHVGWSAVCACAAWLAIRRPRPRTATLVWLFPLVMVAVVITPATTTSSTWSAAQPS
ncbi:phosphatase PAP2 family protein [Intrasporangium sp.]|uniref:phosphatase PAP2 family protein n=1 Tax=Intrasporangium sp. TaxID=1925024 RepID=UPI00322191FC